MMMFNDIPIRWVALDQYVIAVAKERVDGWAAYIGSVPGKEHEHEWIDVLHGGTKLDEAVAIQIFPEFLLRNYCP